MAAEPALLVADEPTTALDVVAQKRVMDLLEAICRKTGVAVLLITHNLGLVAGYAESLSVMYAGLIVEQGDARQPARHPRSSAVIEPVGESRRRARRQDRQGRQDSDVNVGPGKRVGPQGREHSDAESESESSPRRSRAPGYHSSRRAGAESGRSPSHRTWSSR